jgi:hypothetical protein
VRVQACIYRKMEAGERAALLQQLVKQLDVLEGICVGPYIAGALLLLLLLLLQASVAFECVQRGCSSKWQLLCNRLFAWHGTVTSNACLSKRLQPHWRSCNV